MISAVPLKLIEATLALWAGKRTLGILAIFKPDFDIGIFIKPMTRAFQNGITFYLIPYTLQFIGLLSNGRSTF